MVERRTGLGGEGQRVDPRQQVGAALLDACQREHVAHQIEQPVDVEGRGQVGLHLRIGPGRREAHRVPGAIGVEPHRPGIGRVPHVHPRRSDDRDPGLPFGIVEPRTERGADHVDVAEHHRQPLGQPDPRGGSGAQRVRRLRPVHDGRQQPDVLPEPELPDRQVGITARAVVTEGEDAFGRIGGALAGQLEVEPVLAVERRDGAGEGPGSMAGHPGELARLLAGRHPGGGGLVQRPVPLRGADGAGLIGGAAVEPQPRGTGGSAAGVDQPGAVPLPRHRQRHGPPGDPRRIREEVPQRPGGLLPGPGHVLLRRAAGVRAVVVRAPGDGDLLSGAGERHGLHHRSAGIDADDDVPGHAGASPWESAAPVSASKT